VALQTVHKHNAKRIIRILSSQREKGSPYSAIGFGGLYRTVNPMSEIFGVLAFAAESPYHDQIS